MSNQDLIIEIIKFITSPILVGLFSILILVITKCLDNSKFKKHLQLDRLENMYNSLTNIKGNIEQIRRRFISETDYKITPRVISEIEKEIIVLQVGEALYSGQIGLLNLQYEVVQYLEYLSKQNDNTKKQKILNDARYEEINNKKVEVVPTSFDLVYQPSENLFYAASEKIANKIQKLLGNKIFRFKKKKWFKKRK